MRRNLHPTEGARFLFERTSDEGAQARYRAQIYTPTELFESSALLGEDGRVELPPSGAPAALDERLLVMARLIARDAAKRRADGLGAWPDRVLRWRK